MWTCYDYDTETGADVAYILLADVHPGESAIKLVKAQVRPEQEVSSSIDKAVRSLILEFDDEDRLIAIEVWGASGSLPKSFLDTAAHEARPRPAKEK